jgi:ribosomal-protein-alanine N-acetyltransferase
MSDQFLLPFRIEPMQSSDIPQVIAIEQAAYATGWPQKAYDYELEENELAHYFVLRTPEPDSRRAKVAEMASPLPEAGPERLAHFSRGRYPSNQSNIIGLAGFWLMVDEAHINTLAVHPTWRGLGLGEWLLLTLIEKAQALGATLATLEVRPSNQVALSLYQKYNFQEVGRRPGYYNDNGEDALILTTTPLSLLDYQAMLRQRKAMLFQQLTKINVNKMGLIN